MRGGSLRYRIAVDVDALAPNVPDDGGQRVVTTRIVTNEPAAIRDRTADERSRSIGVLAEATHDVVMRYRPGLSAAMRIVTQGDEPARTFEIRGVTNDARRETLTLACVERV